MLLKKINQETRPNNSRLLRTIVGVYFIAFVFKYLQAIETTRSVSLKVKTMILMQTHDWFKENDSCGQNCDEAERFDTAVVRRYA